MREVEEHGNWLIWHDPLPIEWRGADWHYARKTACDDFDVGNGDSREMCLQSIDFIESEETPAAQAEITKQSSEFLDRLQNVPLVRQLAAALNAARSMAASGGKGFADGAHAEIIEKALADYHAWEADRAPAAPFAEDGDLA